MAWNEISSQGHCFKLVTEDMLPLSRRLNDIDATPAVSVAGAARWLQSVTADLPCATELTSAIRLGQLGSFGGSRTMWAHNGRSEWSVPAMSEAGIGVGEELLRSD